MGEHYYCMLYMRLFNAAPAFVTYLRTHKLGSDRKKKGSPIQGVSVVVLSLQVSRKESQCHLESAPNYELAATAKEYLNYIRHYVPGIYQA